MLIGIPKEIKNHEYRVATTPAIVKVLKDSGHSIIVEAGAGLAAGYSDLDFTDAGASIVSTAKEAYDAELIVKVKEPLESEFQYLRQGQILFCFLHLAAEPLLTHELIKKKVTAIAYETVTDAHGRLPLLLPMSEIAGRISIQIGATALQLNNGGCGILLGGVPGIAPAKVLVVGGGIAGTEAARMALGLGADVTIIDRSLPRLRYLSDLFGSQLKTLYSTEQAIKGCIKESHLVIGSVLIPGKKAPKLITREMIASMPKKSVFVDISIDQGGCAETSKPTTHSDPTYVVDDVIHYCVTNIPGACSRTSTEALTNATLEYVLTIANKGYQKALKESYDFRNGLNVYLGSLTNYAVAQDLGYPYVDPLELI